MAAQEATIQDGYYVWSVPGGPVVIHLHLDLVDRLAAEVMRGFGAVPKRGAEVGGLLIGTIQKSFPAVVRIDDFEPVECAYRRGPSYLFTETDGGAFKEAWERWDPSVSPSYYTVGYYRSNTRESEGLDADDLDLLDHFFPSAAHVALLVSPYATKVSIGGFFARENGEFPRESPLEFPLRRRDLAGEEAPPRRLAVERGPAARQGVLDLEPPAETARASAYYGGAQGGGTQESTIRAGAVPAVHRAGNAWVWVLLSFVFLLLGGLLGYQAAQTMGARASATTPQMFELSLAVTRMGDTLNVRWDRNAPAVRSSQKGVLEIEDGGPAKPLDLDAAQLQNGTLIYRNTAKSVRFRLTVNPSGRVSVTETVNWKE